VKYLSIRVQLILLAFCLFAISCVSASAQLTGGTLTGTLSDVSGATIVGATAKATNTATGVSTTAITNQNGLFHIVNLVPGSYELTLSQPGFTTALKKGIALEVGQVLTVNFTLNIASSAETIEVTSAATTVDVASASLSYEVSGTTMREMPMNGRDFTSLAALQPGVAQIGTQVSQTMRAGFGVRLSISGTRPSTNNFLFDGISINDSGNNTPGSALGVTLGVEAVDQFRLISGTISAEYGRAAGGVLNAVTRSGTNTMHGSAFYFGRNSAIDARNYFDLSTLPKPEYRRSQYGGSLGWRIFKDRTFFFGDYEGVSQLQGVTTNNIVPSDSARAGNLASGTVTVAANIAQVLNELYPHVNNGLLGNGDTGYYTDVLNGIGNERYMLGKINHKLTEKDGLAGSYFYDTSTLTLPDVFNQEVIQTTGQRQSTSLEDTHTFTPALLNVGRFGFARSVMTSGMVTKVLNTNYNDTSLGFVPGKDIGGLTVSGITALPAGPTAQDYSFANYNSFQGYDSLYWDKGIHAIKMGMNVERMQYNSSQPNLGGGSFSYPSLQSFLTDNQATNFSALLLGSNDERGLRQTLLGFYIQDDVKVNHKLTANVGLRYELATVPTESRGLIALLPNLLSPTVRTGGPIMDTNGTLKDFEPRVGVSYDPRGNGKTVVHAGFAIYDNLPLPYLFDTPLMRSIPYNVQGVLNSSATISLKNTFPNGGYPLISGGNASQLRTTYVDVHPPRSYTMQWNVNVQREFLGNVLTVGYDGSRGVHLVQVERNMNTVQPTLANGVYTFPNCPSGNSAFGTCVASKLNPNFATINTTDTWNADSTYAGGHVSLSRSMNHGLQMQVSYAFSKSLDDSSSTSSVTAGTGYPNAIGSPDPLFPWINRGYSDFDIRHNMTVSGVYDIPGLKTSLLPLRVALTGWELGVIFKAQTGVPMTPVLNNDQAYLGADTTAGALGELPNWASSSHCKATNVGQILNYINASCFSAPAPNTLGNVRRNALTAPGFEDMDFSVIRNDKFGERLTSQFRLEMFNFLNHPNFNAPNTTVFTGQTKTQAQYDLGAAGNYGLTTPANFGIITSTLQNLGRQIQFGLKLTF
jgi:Carboxypeptidase regulatory-like domain/TonB-dependent Receptor Plug Domain